MRSVVVTGAMGAALAFIAASCLMNLVFMSSLGTSGFEEAILGVVSIAISVFIALLPTLMLWACREKRWLYVGLGLPMFFIFATFSLSSAVGFSAKNRGGAVEDRNLASARLGEVKKAVADGEEKKKTLGAPRPASVVEEAMRGLQQDPRWPSSRQCEDATLPASRDFCKRYFDLKAEAAQSNELTALEARLDGLKREARQYEDKGGGREADNQAAVIGRIVGLSAVEVEERLTLLLAVLVETGAALGLYFATGHMRMEHDPVVEVRRAKKKRSSKKITGAEPRRVPPRHTGTGLVVYTAKTKR